MKNVGLTFFEKRDELLVFLAGFNLILLNFILVQHFTAAMRRAEVAVILFSLSYFSGISLGFLSSDKISPRLLRGLLPVFFAIQMLMLVFGQPAIFVLARLHPWVMYGVLFLTVSIFSTSLYAVFLPAAIDSGGGLTRLYSFEILGSILGLAAVPLLAGISHELLLLGYFLIFLSLGALLKMKKHVLIGLMLLTAFFTANYHQTDQALSAWVYRQRYPQKDIRKVIFSRYTPYHKIELAEEGNSGDLILLLNGKHQFSRGSYRSYSYYVAEYPSLLLNHPKTLVLGCGSMATVGRLRERASSIQIVDLDEKVFETSKRFFQKFNHLNEFSSWNFKADDAKHYLGNSRESFDLILHDIPPARSRQTALTYTAEFFQLVKQRLTPSGLFSISSLTPLNSKSSYGKKVIKTLTHVFENYFVLDAGSAVYFYGGGREREPFAREQLERMLPPSRRREVRILLQKDVDSLVKDAEVITINNVGDLIFG